MGWAIWITGLPGSGKSTIATSLFELLRDHGMYCEILRMDNLRNIVTPNPSYSEDERELVYSSLIYAALLLTRNNIDVVIDATGNKRSYRRKARKLIPKFMEVYVKCPLEICIKRERSRIQRWNAPKGIYNKASKGISRSVPGVNVPYEEPLIPDVIIDSSKINPKEAAHIIYLRLKKRFK
jgi:adenylylsulfate kinase